MGVMGLGLAKRTFGLVQGVAVIGVDAPTGSICQSGRDDPITPTQMSSRASSRSMLKQHNDEADKLLDLALRRS